MHFAASRLGGVDLAPDDGMKTFAVFAPSLAWRRHRERQR
jgi:hypothetical protein